VGSSVDGLYDMYQSLCPFVQSGSPRPLSSQRVCPPALGTKGGGGQHSRAGLGGGGAISDAWGESLALCILCGLKCDQGVRGRVF